MLLPIDHVWKSFDTPTQEAPPPVLLVEEKVAPPSSVSIPLPTLPSPETIQSTCSVLMVILLFFILLEVKHLVRTMAKLLA